MSLEATLARTNELLEALLTRLNTANEVAQELGEPEVKKTRTRKTKEYVEPPLVTSNVATATDQAGSTQTQTSGHAAVEASRYFVIEKHNTVYEQKPGMPACNIDGAVEVSADIYEQKKVEFAQKVEAAIAANTTKPDARDGLTATQAVEALHGHVNKPVDDVPFEQVVAKMVALNKSDKAGHGPNAVRAILVKYMPNEDKPTVPKLNGLGKNAEILAEVEALLNPATDDIDLFA